MSIPPKNNNAIRTEELFQAWLGDEMSESEARELLDLWRQDPDVLRAQQKEFQVEQYLRFFSELRKNDPSAARTLLEDGEFPRKAQSTSLRFSEDSDFDEKLWKELKLETASKRNYGNSVWRHLRQIPIRSALLVFALFLMGIFSFGLYLEYTKSGRPLFEHWNGIARHRDLKPAGSPKSRQNVVDPYRAEDQIRRSAAWNEDPSLLLRPAFDSIQDSMQASVLNNAAEHSELRVSRFGGTAEPGSGKKSLRFQKAEDRLETFLPDRYGALTFFARIRIDRFDHVNQTLLVSENLYSDGGGVLWQINSFGDLQFHVRSSGGETQRYDAKNVFPKRETETWLNLAVVFDSKAKTVTHYLEGESVATLPMDLEFEIQPGLISLGNGFPGTGSGHRRFLSGGMEEFMIFGRALSESEVRELCYDL